MRRTVTPWVSLEMFELGGALEQEALGDVVGVVVDEGLFDEHVEVVEGDADGAALEGLLGEVGGDLAGDVGDEALVLLVEDVLLAPGLEEVGEGAADGVGDLAEIEALVAVRAEDMDLGDGDLALAEDIAPVVVRFLVLGGGGEFFEREILRDGRRMHGWGRRMVES